MPQRYWFPAKRYGWGWGPPIVWQGRAALAALIVLAVLGALVFPPPRALPEYMLWVLALTAGFFALCWWKGEPPRWRWGDKD